MSNRFQCGDNTSLVTYLYGECEPSERTVIATHVAACPACAAELAALESTRIQLASWTPPDLELGFAVVRSGVRPDKASRAKHPPLPSWLQAVAAVAIFAAGLALGVARGILPAASPIPVAAENATAATPPVANAQLVSAVDLNALEGRLRDEIAQMRTAVSARAAANASSPPEAELLALVRALIDESEQRQRRELALRTAQIIRDVDSQRRVDLEQIHRSVGQFEGLTGAEVREQRQLLNYLMRVSQQR